MPAQWHTFTSLHIPGRSTIYEGDELTVLVLGVRLRRVRFMSYTHNETTGKRWINAWDGKSIRSFDVAAIHTVHRGHKMTKRGAS